MQYYLHRTLYSRPHIRRVLGSCLSCSSQAMCVSGRVHDFPGRQLHAAWHTDQSWELHGVRHGSMDVSVYSVL
jgi:hypothetical protein